MADDNINLDDLGSNSDYDDALDDLISSGDAEGSDSPGGRESAPPPGADDSPFSIDDEAPSGGMKLSIPPRDVGRFDEDQNPPEPGDAPQEAVSAQSRDETPVAVMRTSPLRMRPRMLPLISSPRLRRRFLRLVPRPLRIRLTSSATTMMTRSFRRKATRGCSGRLPGGLRRRRRWLPRAWWARWVLPVWRQPPVAVEARKTHRRGRTRWSLPTNRHRTRTQQAAVPRMGLPATISSAK